MAEKLSLTVPVTPTLPTIADYTVWALYLGPGDGSVRVVVEDTNKVRTTHAYFDEPGNPIATTLIRALNTANNTQRSLQRRVLERLVADGKLPAGTVTGTPDTIV
jgi:hypothetical protein